MTVETFFFGMICVIGTFIGVVIILFSVWAILATINAIKSEFF